MMLVKLRRSHAQLATSAAQLLLIGFAFKDGTRTGVLLSAGLMAALGFVAWMSALRHARMIDDTPTSRVASAAQGYVELQGSGRPLGGLPLRSPLTGLPCLWYRYRVERRDNNNKWVHDDAGESDSSFLLDDGSGQCMVDPEGAEILVTRRDTWTRGERRYTQWLVIEHDPLYALGHFVTRGSADLELDVKADVGMLLAQWKEDRKHLLHRFDLDRDGEISLDEWELARRQARREVLAVHREARGHAELHVLHAPADGRLYLISTLPPETLALRYRRWSRAHLVFFFLGLAGIAYAVRLGA